MPKALHPVAGGFALLMIVTFWVSTVVAELSDSPGAVVAVKTTIPWAFLLLIPAMAAAGGTGLRLAKGKTGGLADVKRRRMPIIAANGLIVLVPAALFLAAKARAGDFDGTFYAIQAVELIAGAVNIALLGLNMRDGLRMTGVLPKPAP
jgi:hypothetical protein